jgi:hypothetical protein
MPKLKKVSPPPAEYNYDIMGLTFVEFYDILNALRRYDGQYYERARDLYNTLASQNARDLP